MELPGARPGYIEKGLRSNDMPRPAHALSVYPPWRAQMSAARRACGRAELVLRRRCFGCRSGSAAPRAKGLFWRQVPSRRCARLLWSTSGPKGPRRRLRRRVPLNPGRGAGDAARETTAGRAVGRASVDLPPRPPPEASVGAASRAVATPRVVPGPAHAGSRAAPAHGAAVRAVPAVRASRLCLETGRLKAASRPRKAAEKHRYSGDFFSRPSVVVGTTRYRPPPWVLRGITHHRGHYAALPTTVRTTRHRPPPWIRGHTGSHEALRFHISTRPLGQHLGIPWKPHPSHTHDLSGA